MQADQVDWIEEIRQSTMTDWDRYWSPSAGCEVNKEPLLTVLNFSAGKQSSCLLWMVIRGDLPRPANFVVLTADPGMENSQSYEYREMMYAECDKAGIEYRLADGPNLVDDILALETNGKTRIDNPPYWTKDPKTGKEGKLRQGCTKYYKIDPMDRAIRAYLEERHGIPRKNSRLGVGIVEKWIGFSSSEKLRVKAPAQKYTQFHYPLMRLKMDNDAVVGYFLKNDLPLPPRSVCNACFANGLGTLKEMHDHRPADWEQACKVDDAMRDSTQIGVERPVFVSKSLIPLRDLPALDFKIPGKSDSDGYSCDSGYCFT